MKEFDDLKAEVAATKDAEQSAVKLLNGITTKLAEMTAAAAAAGKDQISAADIKALGDDLKASTDALASAVVAGTPAAPAPASVDTAPASGDTTPPAT